MSAVAHAKFDVKRLVVFGAGYVGGALARDAVARGLRVVALTRNEERARELRAAGVEVIVGELASDAWHAQAGRAGESDWVVNCVSAGGGGVEGYRRSYVDGMMSVAAWLKNVNVGASQSRDYEQRNTGGTPVPLDPAARSAVHGRDARATQSTQSGRPFWVYTSSTSVYPQTGGVRVREVDDVGGDEQARLLLEAERLALGGGACVLRLAGIYGPGRHLILDQVREGAGEISGRGDFRLNLIHRDDSVSAIWAALEAGSSLRGEVLNVCDDGAASRAEVVAWLAERLGVAMPRFSGIAAAARKSALLDRVISNEKIKTRTCWRPRFASFREGYEALLRA